MDDQQPPEDQKRQIVIGGVAIGSLIAAGCAVAFMNSDGPSETAQTDDASYARGATPEVRDRSLTPMAGPGPASRDAFKQASIENGFADFIVKFRDTPELDAILRQFRKDEASARQAFARWASTQPGLSGFELTGATYSGEALLRYNFREGAAPTRAAVDELMKQLRSAPNVAYCDPDFTAQPGDGRE